MSVSPFLLSSLFLSLYFSLPVPKASPRGSSSAGPAGSRIPLENPHPELNAVRELSRIPPDRPVSSDRRSVSTGTVKVSRTTRSSHAIRSRQIPVNRSIDRSVLSIGLVVDGANAKQAEASDRANAWQERDIDDRSRGGGCCAIS